MATCIKPKAALYTVAPSVEDNVHETIREHYASEFAEARGFRVAGCYADNPNSRTELSKLVNDARENRFQTVIVYEADAPFPDSATAWAKLFALWKEGVEVLFSSHR